MNTKSRERLVNVANGKGKKVVFQGDPDYQELSDRRNERHVDMDMVNAQIQNFIDLGTQQFGEDDLTVVGLKNLLSTGSDVEKLRFVHTPENVEFYFDEDLERIADYSRQGLLESGKVVAKGLCQTYCDYHCWCVCYGPFGNDVCRQECREKCYQICRFTFEEKS